MLLSEEIRSILDGEKKSSSSVITEEFKEAVDEAMELLKTHTNLTSLLQKKLDAVSSAFGVAKKVAMKAGTKTPDARVAVFEAFEAAPLSALRELRTIIDKSIKHVENVCRNGKYQRSYPAYGGSWINSLAEGKDPMGGSNDLQSYGDYVPAMGKIEPGMAVNLGGKVFRVIGKSGNSALVQLDSLRKQSSFVPGKGYPTPQSPVPSGTTVPQDVNQKPVKGNLSNPTGHTSLVGTMVLQYNPHSGMFRFCTGKMPGDYEMATTIQVVGHDPSLPNIAEDVMTVERFEMMVVEAEAEDVIEKLRIVSESEDSMLVNGVMVDPSSALLAVEMYDGFNSDSSRTKMENLDICEMMDAVYRVIDKININEESWAKEEVRIRSEVKKRWPKSEAFASGYRSISFHVGGRNGPAIGNYVNGEWQDANGNRVSGVKVLDARYKKIANS